MKADVLGPGQRFDIAAAEVCGWVLTSGNTVTIRWVPSHKGILDNEKADEFARAVAERSAPSREDVTNELLDEASLSYMSRTATEQVPGHGGVDLQPRRRPPVQAPSRERPTPPAPPQHQGRIGRTVLPISVWPRRDWVVSSRQDPQDRLRQVLVVQHQRSSVQIPPCRQVPRVGGARRESCGRG